MNGFSVNTYVLHAPDGDIIVDAGAEPEKILLHTRSPVAAILITHGHADHVGALRDMRRATGAQVFIHPEDAAEKGGEYHELRDGEDLQVAGANLRVMYTPGHSPGSVTFVLGDHQIVGDLILPGSVGRTDLHGGSWGLLELSLRKVMASWNENTLLYPGHGPVLRAMDEVKTNPYLPLGIV